MRTPDNLADDVQASDPLPSLQHGLTLHNVSFTYPSTIPSAQADSQEEKAVEDKWVVRPHSESEAMASMAGALEAVESDDSGFQAAGERARLLVDDLSSPLKSLSRDVSTGSDVELGQLCVHRRQSSESLCRSVEPVRVMPTSKGLHDLNLLIPKGQVDPEDCFALC